MAGKPEGGIRDVLALDQAADDLNNERAAAAENDADAEQLGLFAGGSVFGQLRRPGGEPVRSGPGRPRGSRNRSTRDIIKLVEASGKHPLIAMAEIVATPIDVIAATLACDKLEAAEYHRKVMSDLAPYVAQKLPTAVQVQGANAGMLVINLGGPVGEGASGLDMKLIDAEPVDMENQALSGHDDAQSHDAQSHDEAK